MKALPFTALLLLLNGDLFGQQTANPLPSKDSIRSDVRRIQRGESDEVRKEANLRLHAVVSAYLQNDSAFESNPELAENIACVNAPDGKWRILSWVLPSFSGDSYVFQGYLQYKSADRKRTFILRLSDSTSVIKKPESERLSAEKWFGAAYYQTVAKRKSRKNYYVLLGWKGRNSMITQKVIDVLYFDGDKPRFGYPIFKKEKVFRSRVVFSYMSQVSMTLRYEPSKRIIVFDHLFVPKTADGGSPDAAAAVPDGSYDGYRFSAGKWQYRSDLNMRSRQAPK